MEELGRRGMDLLVHVYRLPSYTATSELPVKYFLATDTAAIMDQAQQLYTDGEEIVGVIADGSKKAIGKGRLLYTPDEPKHPATATKQEQLKILLDWCVRGCVE
jgi:hypothetical protein